MARPSIRWGILGTGWVSTNFVKDLLLSRPDGPVSHIVQALGTSSTAKGATFTEQTYAQANEAPRPRIYTNYEDVYNDPDVDVVYVGVPHSMHKDICLQAIAKNKHVLCEKPIAMNEQDAREMVEAARKKGVYLMEGVWTRFMPIVRDLQHMVHEEKVLGRLQRLFCDFGLDQNLESLPSTSRLRDPTLGAGALLDIGIYPLTYANIFLDGHVGEAAANPTVSSSLVVRHGIDIADNVILSYPRTQATAILTATTEYKSMPVFLRLEGSKGTLTLSGFATSAPRQYVLCIDGKESNGDYRMKAGFGFYYEADAVAMDILSGRTESAVIPLAESLRMMRMMDSIRKAAGLVV